MKRIQASVIALCILSALVTACNKSSGDVEAPAADAADAHEEPAQPQPAPEETYILTLEYIYSESTGHRHIAEALRRMWAEIGIELVLRGQDWDTFFYTRKNGSYEIAHNGRLAEFDDPIAMLGIFAAGSGENDAQWSNADYDALISAAKSSDGREERMRLMHEAEDILFEQWALAPIYYYADIYMLSGSVSGFYRSPPGYKYFMYAEAPGDELAVCVGPNNGSLDPARSFELDGATVCIHAFEGLYSFDGSGSPVPGAASGVEISDDGLKYTFRLRDGLRWSDGSPLTAGDFARSWARAVDPATGAGYEYLFAPIKGYEEGELAVTAPDNKTLIVELTARTPYFLGLTASPVFFPVQQEALEAGGEAWAESPGTYIGNGPYKMVQWVPGSHISFEKNPNYWNYDALGPEVIRFALTDDAGAMLSRFISGELAFIDDVPAKEMPALRNDPRFTADSQLGTYYISFNAENEHLSDPRLREALTLAIDRVYICEQIGQAGQIPAGAFVAPGFSGADPEARFRDAGGDYYNPYNYESNLARAKGIMAELFDFQPPR